MNKETEIKGVLESLKSGKEVNIYDGFKWVRLYTEKELEEARSKSYMAGFADGHKSAYTPV